ncbi:MAG TPA: glycosyltransferase [Verrucomicrobiae bacterium]|nr:glycosyltransferase [Verrucomicrobiae bacterium]
MESLVRKAKFLFAGDEKFVVRGVAYGPFRPGGDNPEIHLPGRSQVVADLGQIAALGANAVRLYHVPPAWFLDEAEAAGIRSMITVPWTQHVAFLGERSSREEVLGRVRACARAVRGRACVAGLLVGNEVPSDLVRWMGPDRVSDFLDDLIDAAKQEDPDRLISYASYPPTEYLVPNAADFVTFNVYLHREVEFRNYLSRLHSVAGDRPLLLAEFGMDTVRHGERAQAELLAWHIGACEQGGAAGTVLFSWTDEWYTGGMDVGDWAFGLVTRDRRPKLAYDAVRSLWRDGGGAPAGYRAPTASVVVCAFNAASTLPGALRSLDRLNYPEYEVILVDDGSCDGTQSLVEDFLMERSVGSVARPEFKNIVQENRGLSAARNAGIAAARGDVVAFTDADCVADADWLRHLCWTLSSGKFAAVGGPNLAPPAEGWVEACVAVAPGAPNHVLLSDVEAEHVPGCNMAFWKGPLQGIGGFDEDYRVAGDDVDICWRLMAQGYRIGFSPAAVVWHRRRGTVAAYLGQQRGYGEAESLLRFNHAVFFGPLGGARWRGTVYGQPDLSLLPWRPVIYHGAFGLGMFQCAYGRRGGAWAAMVSSVEWCLAGLYALLLGVWWSEARVIGVLMIWSTLAAGAVWAWRARIEGAHDTGRARLMLWFLAVAQPLVRGWARYTTWIRNNRTPSAVIDSDVEARERAKPPESFWNERGVGRLSLLKELSGRLQAEGWRFSLDPGWMPWDVEVFGSRWWCCRLRTADEHHGGPKVLVRVAYDMRPTAFQWLVRVALVGGMIPVLRLGAPAWAVLCLAIVLAAFLHFRSSRLRGRLGTVVGAAAEACGLSRVSDGKG